MNKKKKKVKEGLFPGQLVQLLGNTSFDEMTFAVISKVLKDGRVAVRSINNKWKKDAQDRLIRNVEIFDKSLVMPVQNWSMSPVKYAKTGPHGSSARSATESALYSRFRSERLHAGKKIDGGYIVIGFPKPGMATDESLKILVQHPGEPYNEIWYPCWLLASKHNTRLVGCLFV